MIASAGGRCAVQQRKRTSGSASVFAHLFLIVVSSLLLLFLLLRSPFDVLKSVIQTAPAGTPSRELTMAHVARTSYRVHGGSFFFKGLAPAIIRAIPVSAVTFYVYERCLDWMGRE